MTAEALQCSACGIPAHDPSATVYAGFGDLVCQACGVRAKDAAAEEDAAEGRREKFLGLAALVPAFVTFALFVYDKHDERWVYVGSGGDASWSVLRSGISFALMAGFAGGFVGFRIIYGRKKR